MDLKRRRFIGGLFGLLVFGYLPKRVDRISLDERVKSPYFDKVYYDSDGSRYSQDYKVWTVKGGLRMKAHLFLYVDMPDYVRMDAKERRKTIDEVLIDPYWFKRFKSFLEKNIYSHLDDRESNASIVPHRCWGEHDKSDLYIFPNSLKNITYVVDTLKGDHKIFVPYSQKRFNAMIKHEERHAKDYYHGEGEYLDYNPNILSLIRELRGYSDELQYVREGEFSLSKSPVEYVYALDKLGYQMGYYAFLALQLRINELDKEIVREYKEMLKNRFPELYALKSGRSGFKMLELILESH